jgi:hypothetical protein
MPLTTRTHTQGTAWRNPLRPGANGPLAPAPLLARAPGQALIREAGA